MLSCVQITELNIMNTEQLYQERLNRYVTALRNEKPDCVPIRPFVAEFTAKYAGYTCQEVAHDYTKAFEAAVKCAHDFGWDAVVPNMVYVWTGLAQAVGLRYYGIPGLGIPHDVGFNYIEPPEEKAWMRADEYDALIDDPTAFLYNVWLPRVSTEVSKIGEPSTYRNNLSCVKGAMAMLSYFYAFGPQIARLRSECGTVSAIAGIFKAPFDIIADKLRGYVGLTMDMQTQPEKVLKACEALSPHLCHVGLTTSDPASVCPSASGCTAAVCRSSIRSSSSRTIGRRSSRSSRSSGAKATRRCFTRRATGTRTSTLSPSCRIAVSSIMSIAATFSRCTSGSATNSASAAASRTCCSATARRRKCASSASASSTPWRKTAATSWTPAPSCRTTRASKTCAR